MKELILKMISENPEAVISLVKGYIEQYKPIVYGLCNEGMGIIKDYVNNDEIYELRATAKKKAFDAYVSAGFTADQAIAFILNDNLQLVKGLQQMTSSSNKSTKSANK